MAAQPHDFEDETADNRGHAGVHHEDTHTKARPCDICIATLCRSAASSQARGMSGADSTQSLDAAADMVLAQLGTVLEDPTAEVTSFKQVSSWSNFLSAQNSNATLD